MTETQTEPGSEINSSEIKISRRRFLQLFLMGGGVALLSACGIKPEKEAPAEIPQVSIDEIISHPDLYEKLPVIKVLGYPEAIGKKVISYPVAKYGRVGNITTLHFDWITTETDTYKLHSAPDQDSSSVETSVSGGTYFPVTPLVFEEQYEVIGNIIKAKENNEDKYLLKVSSASKQNLPTPQPGK